MKRITKLILLVLLMATVFTACSKEKQTSTTDGANASFSEMKGADLDKIMEDKKQKENHLVIDVRSKEEYDAGHVKFAINIPTDELEKRLSEIEDWKDKSVITICNTGKKSATAAEILVKNGFQKVANAEGVKSFTYTTMTKVTSLRGADLQAIADAGTHTIIDVREPKDFEAGHLKGAINVPVDALEEKLAEIPMDKPIVAHCYTGNRSMQIAESLVEKGYSNVANALDGTKEFEFKLEQ